MHIALLVQQPVSVFDAERFGVYGYLSRGSRVTAVNVFRALHSDLDPPVVATPVIDGFEHISIDRSASGLEKLRDVTFDVDAILNAVGTGAISAENAPVLKFVFNANKPIVDFGNSVMPYIGQTQTENVFQYWLARLSRLQLKATVLSRLHRLALGPCHSDFVLLGGAASVGAPAFVGPDTRQIAGHAFDYDRVLEVRKGFKSCPYTEGEYILYMDQMLGFHPEVEMHGRIQPFDKELYYPRLREYLSRVEDRFALPVIVAGHPRSANVDLTHFYGDRPIIRNQTAALTYGATIVLSAFSTSVTNAIIMRKPIHLVAPIELETLPYYQRQVTSICDVIGADSFFLGDEIPRIPTFSVDVDSIAYDQYTEAYIKMPSSPEEFTWDIIYDALFGETSSGSAGLSRSPEGCPI